MKYDVPPHLGPAPRSRDHIASGNRFNMEKKDEAFSALTISLGKLSVSHDKDRKEEVSVAKVREEIDAGVKIVSEKDIEVEQQEEKKDEDEEEDAKDDEEEEGELCHRSPERPSHGGHRLEPYMNQSKLLFSGGVGQRVREETVPVKLTESLNISKDHLEDLLDLDLDSIGTTNYVMGLVSDYMGPDLDNIILQDFNEEAKIPTSVLELNESSTYDNLPSVSSGYGSPQSVRTASPSNSYLGSQGFYHGGSDNTSSGYHSSPGDSPPFCGYITDSRSPTGYRSPYGDVFSSYGDGQENQNFQNVDSSLEAQFLFSSDYPGNFPEPSPMLPQFLVGETNLSTNTLLLNDDVDLAQLVPTFNPNSHQLGTTLNTNAISLTNLNIHSPHSTTGTSPPSTYYSTNGSLQVSNPIIPYIPQSQIVQTPAYVNLTPPLHVKQRLEAINYFEEQRAKTRLVQKLNEANKSMIWANISTKKDEEITQADKDGDTQLMILLLIEADKCPNKLEFIYSLIERLKDIKGGLTAANKQNHSVLYLAALFYPENDKALITRYIAETMIEKDIDLNKLIVNKENETLLECLCKEGDKHYDVLVELLSLRNKNGRLAFDINEYNKTGMTPLHLAVTNHGVSDIRSIKTVLLLVNKDADTLKKVEGQEENAFHLAIRSSCEPKLVEALLKDKRASSYFANGVYREDTLLHCVARRNDVALEKQKGVYELLMANGVRRDFLGEQGQYPIHLISPSRKEEFRKFCKKR